MAGKKSYNNTFSILLVKRLQDSWRCIIKLKPLTATIVIPFLIANFAKHQYWTPANKLERQTCIICLTTIDKMCSISCFLFAVKQMFFKCIRVQKNVLRLMGRGGVSQTTLLLPNRFYPENVGIGPKIFLTSKSLFQNAVVLRRPRVDIFGDIMKVVTMFTKTIFKDSLYFLI